MYVLKIGYLDHSGGAMLQSPSKAALSVHKIGNCAMQITLRMNFWPCCTIILLAYFFLKWIRCSNIDSMSK